MHRGPRASAPRRLTRVVQSPPTSLCVALASRFKNSQRRGLSPLLEQGHVKPLTFRYLPLFRRVSPPPPRALAVELPRRAASRRAASPCGGEVGGREASVSVRDVVEAVVVGVVEAEQLAVLGGEQAASDLVVVLRRLVPHGPPHAAVVLHGVVRVLILPFLRRRGWERGRLEVHHPGAEGELLLLLGGAGSVAAVARAVPQRGGARHRGHLPIRGQHIRHHPLPAAQVRGIWECELRGSVCGAWL